MTDETDLPAGDSAESDAVRRLLAQARHDEPMPADVAARMDRVLADLAASPVPDDDTADEAPTLVVSRLPARRRWQAAALLASAAAIVVAGVVFAQNRPLGTGSATTAGTAASGAESNDRFVAGAKGNDDQLPVPNNATAGGSSPRFQAVVRDGLVVVRRHSFVQDALAGRSLLHQRRSAPLAQSHARCGTPSGARQVVPALYDKAPAALVYHRPRGSTQVVDLVLCGAPAPVRSATLPAP